MRHYLNYINWCERTWSLQAVPFPVHAALDGVRVEKMNSLHSALHCGCDWPITFSSSDLGSSEGLHSSGSRDLGCAAVAEGNLPVPVALTTQQWQTAAFLFLWPWLYFSEGLQSKTVSWVNPFSLKFLSGILPQQQRQRKLRYLLSSFANLYYTPNKGICLLLLKKQTTLPDMWKASVLTLFKKDYADSIKDNPVHTAELLEAQ